MIIRITKNIFFLAVVFLLLFPNFSGNGIGDSKKNDNTTIDNTSFSRNIGQDTSTSNSRQTNTSWSMFRHDLSHTGRSQYNTSMNNGRKIWDFVTQGNIASSPAIGSDGTIYFGSDDKKLYALFPNGTKKWEYSAGNDVTSSPAIGSDGIIYVGSNDWKLYALYPNGTKKWEFATGFYVRSSPTIGLDGIIYFGSCDGTLLYALYPNGTKKWEFVGGERVYSSPAIGSDGTIYISSAANNGKLYALYPNGTKKWAFTFGTPVTSSPAIGSDGTIFIGSTDGKLYALNINGNKIWDVHVGSVASSPAIGPDGTVYIGSDSPDCGLHALYPNGTKKWDFVTQGNIASSPAIGSEGTIYFGSDDKKLYALFPNGTEKWDFTTGREVQSSPAISSDGTLYFGSHDYKLYAIGLSTPTVSLNLKAIGGNAQVLLTWKEPDDNGGSRILNYTIYKATTSGQETFIARIGNITTFLDNNVTNGQKYFFQVAANNGIGEGPKSNEAIAEPGTTPTAPFNLVAIPGNAQIALNWTAPIDDGGLSISNYKIYRNGTLLILLGNVHIYIDSGLVNGEIYTYNISAINRAGEGVKSVGVNTAPRSVPSPPRNLDATRNEVHILLTWLVPTSNGGSAITNFSIYRGTTSGSETLFVRGFSGGTSWVDTNITVGTKYFYQVSAVNIAGEGPKSNEMIVLFGISPGLPTRLRVSERDTQVILRWSAPTIGNKPIHYNIYRADSKNGNYTLIAASNTTKYTDKGLKNGHEYWYMINAQNPYGSSGNTTIIFAKPYRTSIVSSLLLIIIITLIIALVLVEITRTSKKKKT
jgi:outer membrane protein assembly factor BamB